MCRLRFHLAFPLTDVRVSDDTDGDLLLVRVEYTELSEELDECALSERVGDGCVKGEGRVLRGEDAHPSSRHPRRHEVALVEHDHHVLVTTIRLLELSLDALASRSLRVARVQNLDQNIARVDHLVELTPDALTLALLEQALATRILELDLARECERHQLRVDLHLVLVLRLRDVRQERVEVGGVRQLRLLALGLRAERVREVLRREKVHARALDRSEGESRAGTTVRWSRHRPQTGRRQFAE